MKLTRKVESEETLEIHRCPICGGEVELRECGYSTFNPGIVKCPACNHEWRLSDVRNIWELGEWWNKEAAEITRKLMLLRQMLDFGLSGPALVQRTTQQGIAAEKARKDQMRQLYEELRRHIIGGESLKKAKPA